jgi:malate dehydrogenase (oxaloacetate-decarboxylating)(NADP+)
MSEELRSAALRYHREPKPGKLEIAATKPMGTQRDLALAYSPGVAAACEAIAEDPLMAFELTVRGNLVGVVTNGTAVLGLGAIGPAASKPVMEGKAVLFKKFAGVDVFDIELSEADPEKLIDIVAALEPTFGGINLEDIKAPECFIVEEALKKRMKIPVFHDDQHGTAIIVTAAIVNGLNLVDKKIEDVKLVASGAGAAALACLNLLSSMGMKRENIWVTDILGVVHEGREEQMDPWKSVFAQRTDARHLGEVIDEADIFLGLSAGGVLKPEMVARMAEAPLVLALANPTPEIMPDEARAVRPDAMICTGRTDFPNQVNNVLCFPYIFRGALDCGASEINEAMKIACVRAIAALAQKEPNEVAAKAMGGDTKRYGPDYLIPNPFDPRLILELAPAVAAAAMESGVASRPIPDIEAYKKGLERYVWRSGLIMKPIFEQAQRDPKRVIFAEGEDERVLRAAQVLLDEGMASPILIGRPEVIAKRLDRLGLRLRLGENVEIINPHDDPRFDAYSAACHRLLGRRGVSPRAARTMVRTNNTVIAALALHLGDADAMICGAVGRYRWHLKTIEEMVGMAEGVRDISALTLIILPQGSYFLADTHVSINPSSDELVEMTTLAADAVKRFGIEPEIALVCHSNFGTTDYESAERMREAVRCLHESRPDLAVDGEMHADAAIDPTIRDFAYPDSFLKGPANLLIFPNLDAANACFHLLKSAAGGLPVGPMLIGTAAPAHVLTSSVTARGIVNMSAVAVVEAQAGVGVHSGAGTAKGS